MSATVSSASNLSSEFRHLCRVAEEALKRGDRRPAENLLKSYRREADSLARSRPRAMVNEGAIVEALCAASTEGRVRHLRDARRKAAIMARLLAAAPGGVAILPNPGNDPPQGYAIAHQRARRPRDPLANMKLTRPQADAAREIRAVYEAMSRAPGLRMLPLDAIRVDRSRSLPDAAHGMSEALQFAHSFRYLPWARRNARIIARIPGLPEGAARLRAVDLVHKVLMECVPLRSLERAFGVANGSLALPFREALDDYWR